MSDSYCPQLKKNERISVLDVAKGLGILLVVFAHINYTPELLIYIYAFHMPLFFLISGVFFNPKKYTFGQFIKNRFLRLICPYLFFYIVILLAKLVFSWIIVGFSVQSLANLKDPFIQMFIAQRSFAVVSAPLWFIPCLFFVEILYYFISKLNTFLLIPICIALVVCGWLLETYWSSVTAYLPWSIDSGLFALGFYCIGHLISSRLKTTIKNVQESKYKKLLPLTISIICFVALIPLAFLNGKVSLGSKILNNGFLFYMTGIIGSGGIIALAIAITNCKFLSFLGKNTFCIMAVHHFINAFLKLIIVKFVFFNYDVTNILHSIIPFLIVLGLSIVCVFVYNFFKNKLFKKVQNKN